MRRCFLCGILGLLLACLYAGTAGAEYVRLDRVRADMPLLNIVVTALETPSGNDARPYLLEAHITAQDDSVDQRICWQSAESPAYERAAALAMLVDYNFDGCKDLQLLTAQGARNVFYAVALWDEAAGCFREVTQHCLHLPGGEIEQEITQAEFCNPEFYPDQVNPGFGRIYSVEADGYAWRTEHVYGWEARYGLTTYSVASVYNAGDGLIGESFEQWGTGLCRWWDQTYPEDWYYGEGNASQKRTEARRELMLGRGTVDGYWMMVDNVDWVNLRQLDRKDSPSLARLARGTEVQVLAIGCGEDSGWLLVHVPGESTSDDDRELDGMTGYIRYTYLEPSILYVANVDWVNVREEPDKASAVATTLNAGDIVYRSANGRDGWIGVSGWKAVDGFSDTMPFTGYIWRSFLEADPFIPFQ